MSPIYSGYTMIRTISGILASLAVLAAGPIAAQETSTAQQVAQGPAPVWAKPSNPLPLPADASGLVFVRAQDLIIHLDAQGESSYVSERIVLLQPQALQLGNVTLSWNPAAGTPIVHAIKIHRGSETIDVLKMAKFEILRREDQLEASVITGVLTAVLKVPDLRVGDELEISYTVPTGDPTLKGQNAGVLALLSSPFSGRYRVGLSWEPGEQPHVQATDDLAGKLVRTKSAVDVRIDNPPAIMPPKDAPPRYAWQRAIEYTRFSGWPALSQRFNSLYAAAARLPADSPLKQEAVRIAADKPDQLGRAQDALKLVQQQVRYVYVGLDGGNELPATADQTWQRRYGDCKAKTVLLLALLKELAVPAEAVLVRDQGSDDGFNTRLPDPGLFDHVLVRATIDGKTYWLDGTLPAVAPPSTAPDLPYHWVLPLTADGHDLESVPWSPASKPDELDLYEIDARAGFDKPAHVVVTSIERGPKALAQYAQMSVLSSDQLLQALRNSLTGGTQWNSIDAVHYHFDVGERASVLEIDGTGPVNWDKSDSPRLSLSLPGGGFIPPDRHQRAADQDQKAPFYHAPDFNCHVTTVRLPTDTKPGDWSYNTTFNTTYYGMHYYRAFDLRDGSLRMIRGERTEQPEISAAEAAQDNTRLSKFDNSMAVLSYDPGAAEPAKLAAVKVPATYEGDWLHSVNACMPKESH
ncbi:MAG: DUF3857 domain-containing protein [Gemmatimonadaceae bacterium]